MSNPSRWWYGVAPFPLVVVTALLTWFATRRFVAVSIADGGDPAVVTGVASFLLAVLAQWVGVFVALVVLVCLVLDVRAIRTATGAAGDDGPGNDGEGTSDTEEWTPTWAWSLAGAVHLAAALFTPLLVVSVPALSVYLYRRRERVGLR